MYISTNKNFLVFHDLSVDVDEKFGLFTSMFLSIRFVILTLSS